MMAFTERLMPGAPGKGGATDACVLNYIDLALSGAYSDQQDFYRRGLTRRRTTAPRPTASRSTASPPRSRTSASPRSNRARRRRLSIRRRKRSSTRCAPIRWKACSPTRSTATATAPALTASGTTGCTCRSGRSQCHDQPQVTHSQSSAIGTANLVREQEVQRHHTKDGYDSAHHVTNLLVSKATTYG